MNIASETLAPIVAEIAAPAATVYGLLSLDIPNSMVQVLPDTTPEGRMALIQATTQVRWRSVEIVIAEPPDTVVYRLVSGPCAQLERHFHVRTRGNHSRVLVEGHWAPGNVFGRLRGSAQVATATRLLLTVVQQQAERMARLRIVPVRETQGITDEPWPEDPALTQRRLLQAIERQEQAEWGMAGHGAATATYAGALATALQLPEQVREAIKVAAAFHDVGKTRIEQDLFNRGSTLSPMGQRRIEQHPQLGAALVTNLSQHEILISAIRHHHERWDGAGYPDRLEGGNIPLAARIIAVAEAADAMMRPLPDRGARTSQDVATILWRHGGKQWDPDLAHRLATMLVER